MPLTLLISFGFLVDCFELIVGVVSLPTNVDDEVVFLTAPVVTPIEGVTAGVLWPAAGVLWPTAGVLFPAAGVLCPTAGVLCPTGGDDCTTGGEVGC